MVAAVFFSFSTGCIYLVNILDINNLAALNDKEIHSYLFDVFA